MTIVLNDTYNFFTPQTCAHSAKLALLTIVVEEDMKYVQIILLNIILIQSEKRCAILNLCSYSFLFRQLVHM